MLNTFTNYFKNENYSILIANNKLYINNYNKIINIKSNEIIIDVKDKRLFIFGKDFILKKMDKLELYITGSVTRVEINER